MRVKIKDIEQYQHHEREKLSLLIGLFGISRWNRRGFVAAGNSDNT
jgi:hypothetical protein